jgi:PAS domain S-box-containing protein
MIFTNTDTNIDSIYRSETFQSFFKHSPRSLLIKVNAPEYTIMAVSENYLLLTHRERNEVLNRPLFEVYPGNISDNVAREKVIASFNRVIETGKTDVLPSLKYDIQVQEHEEMQTFYWSSNNEAVLDEQGNVAYIINTTANITDQVMLNVELEKSKAAAKQLMHQKAILHKLNVELERRVASRTKALSESEARAKFMLADAPVGIALLRGRELIIESANRRILEYWGKSNAVTNRPLSEVLPEIFKQGFKEIFDNAFLTGLPYFGHEVKVTFQREGEPDDHYYNFVYQPLKNEQGETESIMAVAIEVTEQVGARKHLEKIIREKSALENELLENQQRLQSILDTMAEGVGIIDATGQLVYANQMAQEILGLTERQIKSRTYDDPNWINLRVDGSILPSEDHPMAIMMRTGTPIYDQEIAVQPPGKDRFYISINAAPIKDKDGNISGGIGTFMDVTNRRLLMQQKDEFISVASHELKTPITSLQASLQLLDRIKNRPGADLSKLVDQSMRSLTKLNHLVSDLLDVSRIAQGQLMLRKSTFPIAELLNDCCNYIRDTSKFDLVTEGAVNISVYADQLQIDQVLINLVNNAVKYAPDSNRIVILIEELEQEVKISIKDNGPGIPETKVPHIFEKYYRVDHTDRQTTGLGLGLYICAEIIKKHGGEIGLESILGAGTTFWFTLPKR